MKGYKNSPFRTPVLLVSCQTIICRACPLEFDTPYMPVHDSDLCGYIMTSFCEACFLCLKDEAATVIWDSYQDA